LGVADEVVRAAGVGPPAGIAILVEIEVGGSERAVALQEMRRLRDVRLDLESERVR
jgi:hypothetical protein